MINFGEAKTCIFEEVESCISSWPTNKSNRAVDLSRKKKYLNSLMIADLKLTLKVLIHLSFKIT